MSVATAFAGTLLLVTTSLISAAPPSAEEILSRYEQSLSRFNKFSVITEGTTYYKRADQTEERLDARRSHRVLRDHDRWNILISQRSFPFGGPAEGFATEFNYVCNGQVLEVYYPQKIIGVRPDLPSAVNGSPSATAREQSRAVNYLGQTALPFGHFNNVDTRNSLAQVFRAAMLTKATLQSGRDEVGVFIESTQNDGDTLRLWVDLGAGGIMKGLRAVQAADAANANRFKHDRMMVESVYGFAPTTAIKSIIYEVRGVETALCEGQHVITKFETIRTLESVDGKKAHARYVGKLSDWDLSPSVDLPSAFLPSLPVRENARVFNPDEESIRYAFVGGRVVLDINQPTVKALANVKLLKRPPQGTVQWAWGAIAGVLGFLWWRIRASDAM
jgi:hypothetical protein